MNEEAKEFYRTLGEEIKRCREHSNLSLEEVAAQMKLAPSTIAEFESGRRKLSAYTLSMILKIVDADQFGNN